MPVQSRLATLASHLQSSTVSVGGRDYAVSHASGVTTYRCASSSGAVVAMLGAGGGIGQPISMLLKLSPLVSELRLYDVVRTLGVGADLGHIDSDVRRTRPARAAHARWSTETPAAHLSRSCPRLSRAPPPAPPLPHTRCASNRRQQATLTAFVGMEKEHLHSALEGCDLVTMTAGVARKPGMTRDDLFDINAGIVKGERRARPLLLTRLIPAQ